ncbi:uncharacterized protein [Leptinotarsa decemlineata]|uniref:uncharacterized protein n=1 Tax=Leptinotarsa decemlineata TaxID=7539 RepID=UPI003D3066CF
MAIRILLFAFFLFEAKVLLNFVTASCYMKEVSHAKCDSNAELSDRWFSKSFDNFQDIKKLSIRNNNSELLVLVSPFKRFIHLEKLDIGECRIQRLYRYTFKDLPLKKLFIERCGLEEIYEGAFRNLSSLQELSLRKNRLKTVSNGVLKNLPKLAHLTLSGNELSSIENSALENLPELNVLHLDNNKIGAIFIHRIVSYPERLKILWLQNNSLTFVSNYMLEKLTELELLNLGFNKISAIEANSFEHTPKLRTLVLTHNKLKEVDGTIFPKSGMNNLEKLYLDNNELMFLSSSFFFRLNSLKKITLVGNPWDCACLEVINRILDENNVEEKCQDLYVSNHRAVCVIKDATNRVCNYKYDKELSDTYLDQKKKLAPHVPLGRCLL